MATSEITIKFADTEEVKAFIEEANEKLKTVHRILSTLFATEVSDVRTCRECGKPVLHMEHLTLDEAKVLETEVRELLDIPATFEEKDL